MISSVEQCAHIHALLQKPDQAITAVAVSCFFFMWCKALVSDERKPGGFT